MNFNDGRRHDKNCKVTFLADNLLAEPWLVPKAVARKAKVAGAKPPKENESRQVTAEIGLKRGFALEGTRALTFTTIQ